MKIEHKMFHDLIRASEAAGFKVMAETDGLYLKSEPVWLQVHGVSRRSGTTNNICLSAKRPGTKEFHPVALAWFTGNVGLEG